MKKVIVAFVAVFLASILAFCAVAISSISKGNDFLGIDWDNSDVKQVAENPHIGFCEGPYEAGRDVTVFPAEKLLEYESPYRKYASTVHYDTLSDNGKLIYKAMEYAFENKMQSILIDETLCENEDNDDLYKIIRYLALDSPLIEQNLLVTFGNFDVKHFLEDDYFYTRRVPFDGFFITVDNFNGKYFDKRIEAVRKAEEIVASLDESLTDKQKAEELFRYLGKNTKYLITHDSICSYLYDALITGETICDGYANAISLLFNIAGIPCFEKVYYLTNLKPGHTWNCFEIDGKWYNADCTNTDLIPEKDYGYGPGLLFGFPDALQDYESMFADIEPECDEGLNIKWYGEYDSVYDSDFVSDCVAAYRESGRRSALVTVKNEFTDKDIDKQLQKVINRLSGSFYYTTGECVNGYFVFIHNK